MALVGDRAWIWRAVSTEAQNEPDKVSMDEQERVCRAWCEQRNLKVMGVLSVPGLSRSKSDIFDLFEEYERKGIFAYHDLRQLWKKKAIDWLVCYVDERLGRSTSLYTHSIENIIRNGGKVMSVINGLVIDEDNVEQFLAIGGFATSMDVKKLKIRRKMGMRARATRGQRTSPKMPFGYLEVADPRYRKPVLAPDPDYRRILDDLATLLLEGESYHKIEQVMLERYGHGRDGKPYSYQYFRNVLHNPISWGHGAQHFRDVNAPNKLRIGAWIYDETEPLPEGVVMNRNTHAPLYTGELADRVKAEMRRRHDIVGRMRPYATRQFSGLLVCDECGYYMTCQTSTGRNFDYLRCATRYTTHFERIGKCSQTAYIRSDAIQEYFTATIRLMLDTNDLGDFGSTDLKALETRRTAIDKELATIDARLHRLIEAIKTVDPDNPAWTMYTDQIRTMGDQRKTVEASRREAERAILEGDTTRQYDALAFIRETTLTRFWLLPSQTINQTLLRLIGPYRIAAADGEFKRIVVSPPNRRRPVGK